MEGLQGEAKEFGTFLANEGAEQCGFCNPGFIMNVIAMTKELTDPTEDEIKGVSGRKSMPLFRFCGTDQKYSEISGI